MSVSEPSSRLRSLDVYRGITVAAMILVNYSGTREASYPQLHHATWTGWTFADTIFPAFLWIVGVSITLSTGARQARGETRSELLRHAVLRSALLFAIGVALSAFSFPVRAFPHVAIEHYLQFTGVLQKIAVCYLLAVATYLWTGWRGVVAWIVGLNTAYLALSYFFHVPNCSEGAWTLHCNFAGYLDRLLLDGHLTRDPPLQDPDGLGTDLTATSTVLFGVLAGYLFRSDPRPTRRAGWMLASAIGLVMAGALLSRWIPISKPLWTPSFVLLMAGLSSAAMAFWIWVTDVRQWVQWLKPLEIFGMNALAAYIVSVLVRNFAKVHFFGMTLYEDIFRAIASPANASLIYAALHVVGVFLVAWFMYRRRWFLRL